MLRRYGAPLRLSLMAADAASAGLLFLLVSILRFGPAWPTVWQAAGVDPVIAAAAYAAALVTTLLLLGLYRPSARWSWRRDWVDILRGLLLLAVLSLAILFVAKLPNVSRIFLGELFAAQAGVTIASRLIVRRLYAAMRARGYNAAFVLIVGDGPEAVAFARRLGAHAHFGIKVAGHVRSPRAGSPAPGLGAVTLPDAEFSLPTPDAIVRAGRPLILGDIDDLEAILHGTVVDEVAICLPPEALAFVEPVARLCEDEGKIVRIPADTGILLAGAVEDSLDGIRVLSLVRGPDRTLALIGKRGLDICGAIFGMVALAPLLALAGLAIIAEDGLPVLYRQERVGRNGRPFRLLKLRSMVPEADALREDLEARNEIQGHAFKLTHDPRVTRVGRVLRRSSVDELPQLWNVLMGEMSLVGPRPPLPTEVTQYDIWHRRRLAMKPGITGLWQVSARHEVDFDRWVRLDIDYIDRWSLLLDVKIILRTLPALLQGR